uniref:Uncharacterized protein n=1 Tax=Amphimedon queenslandica TaxID=400682 RepID=A0A1X7T4C4_AMPQE
MPSLGLMSSLSLRFKQVQVVFTSSYLSEKTSRSHYKHCS